MSTEQEPLTEAGREFANFLRREDGWPGWDAGDVARIIAIEKEAAERATRQGLTDCTEPAEETS